MKNVFVIIIFCPGWPINGIALGLLDGALVGVSFEHIELGSEYYLRAGGDKWDDVNGNFMYDEGEALTKDKDDDGEFDPGRFGNEFDKRTNLVTNLRK